jgi:hypothetical protein
VGFGSAAGVVRLSQKSVTLVTAVREEAGEHSLIKRVERGEDEVRKSGVGC